MDNPASVSSSELFLDDLFAVPWVFTQTGVIEPSQFVRKARDRGVRLTEGLLEVLHRRRVLTPVAQIHRRPVANPVQGSPHDQVTSSAEYAIGLALRERRLSDPGVRPYSPWPKRQSGPHPVILYSTFQLIGLKSIGHHAATAHQPGAERDAWQLPRLNSYATARFARARQLAMTLEVLAPRYLPRVVHQIRMSGSDLGPLFLDGPPTFEKAIIRLTPDELRAEAERLLRAAGSIDPLGSWARVVRAGNPRRWDDLRFDALIAHEHGVAAEILLLYYEDLTAVGEAQPLPPPSDSIHEARHDRLQVTAQERMETVMRFRLSTRPSVVLALEGETEVVMVEKLLDHHGIDPVAAGLAVVNLQSVDGDVRLLARAVAVPNFIHEGRAAGQLLEPLTGVVVAVDPEKKYKTPELRRQQRDGMVQSVLDSIPPGMRSAALRGELEEVLRVRTWSEAHSFEFAHFTDQELAEGLLRCPSAAPPDEGEVLRSLASVRSKGEDISRAWKDWPRKASKVELAHALWPTLMNKLGPNYVPGDLAVVDTLSEVLDLATELREITNVATDQA